MPIGYCRYAILALPDQERGCVGAKGAQAAAVPNVATRSGWSSTLSRSDAGFMEIGIITLHFSVARLVSCGA